MTSETMIEKVHAGPWNGGKLTAPALATVEKRWHSGELHRDAGRLRIRDTDVRGLELRLSRTGARSWALSRRLDGRQRRFTIENGASMTLAEARKAAIQLNAKVAKGEDPVQERRDSRAAQRAARATKKEDDAGPTLAQLIDLYGRTVARGQRSWPQRRATVRSEYRSRLDKPVAELVEADVLAVLDAAAARGSRVQGFHGFRYLRQILAWALEERTITVNVAASISRRRLLSKVAAPGRRDRVLTSNELHRIWRALEDDPTDYGRLYRLVLLTAQRPGEVAVMRWADVDLDQAIWSQQTNKSDRRHLVPLSAAAVEILLACKPGRGAVAMFPSVRVFSSSAGGELGPRAGNWDRFTKRVMEASRTAGWCRHDLRRTAATLMAEEKVDRGVIEMLLNHSDAAGKGGLVASIYNRYSYGAEMRAAVEKLAERIAAIVEGTVSKDGNVVEIKAVG